MVEPDSTVRLADGGTLLVWNDLPTWRRLVERYAPSGVLLGRWAVNLNNDTECYEGHTSDAGSEED